MSQEESVLNFFKMGIKSESNKDFRKSISKLKLAISLDSEFHNDVIVIEKRYRENQKQFNRNVIGLDKYQIESNKILFAWLELVDNLTESDLKSRNKSSTELSTNLKVIDISEIEDKNLKVPKRQGWIIFIVCSLAIFLLGLQIIFSFFDELSGDNGFLRRVQEPNWNVSTGETILMALFLLFILSFYLLLAYLIRGGFVNPFLDNNGVYIVPLERIIKVKIQGNKIAVFDYLFKLFVELKLELVSVDKGNLSIEAIVNSESKIESPKIGFFKVGFDDNLFKVNSNLSKIDMSENKLEIRVINNTILPKWHRKFSLPFDIFSLQTKQMNKIAEFIRNKIIDEMH